MNKHYKLATGTQVREEDFGLLFYQMNGPKLHFVASGSLLREAFFREEMTIETWMDTMAGPSGKRIQETEVVTKALEQLTTIGVIIEC